MRELVIVVVAVGSAACSGGPADTPAPAPAPAPPAPASPPIGATCEPKLDAAMQRIRHDDPAGFDPAVADRTRLTMIASCEAEHWSDEAVACMATSRLAIDLLACTEKLTYEQHERLHRKLAAINTPPTPPTPVVVKTPVPPTPPTPAVDCRQRIANPRDHKCVAAYCASHPNDVACSIE